MKKRKKKSSPEGLLIPAGVLIGLGIGFITGNIPAWLFIGIGAGFLGMFIAHLLLNKK